jgi:hypothetical protein
VSKYIVEVLVAAKDADNARDDIDWALRASGFNAGTISARLDERCAYCGADMNVLVRGHYHTEDGKDVTRG